MYTKDEILDILSHVIDISKKHDKEGETIMKDGGYPEYWNGYNENYECYNKIRVHSEKGFFPEDLFESRSPNQTEEELCWIRDNYKQITLDVFADYINTRGRAWHKSNWSINYKEDEERFSSNTFQDYVEEKIKVFGSLEKYMRSVMPVLKAKDPEGVIVVKPKNVDLIETEEGFFRLKDDKLLDPHPKYYESIKIVSSDEDYYLIETGEKSIVEYANQKKAFGRVFEFYDNESIWKITQVGKKVNYEFKIELFIKHSLGFVPVKKLQGIPKIVGEDIRWESPFLHAVDNLDLVLLDSSHLQMSKAKSTYPVRIMAANECEYSQDGYSCNSGMLGYIADGMEGRKTCPSCNGTGLKHRLSPLGEIMFNPKEFDENNSSRKLLEYVAPDVKTLEFLQDQIDKNESRARRILHLTVSKEKAQGGVDKTATEMALENKALIAFIKNIADQEFDIFAWTLETIGLMRYGNLFAGFTLHKPTNFDFITEEDYISQISMAKQAGVPPIALRFILTKYVKSIFGNSENDDVIDLIIYSDRLLELSSEEISIKRLNNLIAPWEDVLHCSAASLINEIIMEDPEFLNKKFIEKKLALVEKAKQIASSLTDQSQEIDNIISE